MRTAFVLIAALVVQQQQCNLRDMSANQFQQRFGQELRQYFPKAKVRVIPAGDGVQMLVGVTCAINLGQKMLAQVQSNVQEKFNEQLQSPLIRAVLRVSDVRFLALGFEQALLVRDLVSQQDRWLPADQIPGYAAAYLHDCYVAASVSPPGPVSTNQENPEWPGYDIYGNPIPQPRD